MHSLLEIKSLVLPVYIGRTKEERDKAQDIAFHITIGFTQALKDEKTDKIENSVCYSRICEQIQQLISQKQFFLIEKLAFDTFTIVKKLLPAPNKTRIRVCVQKVHPPVAHLKGGVSYTYGDFF